MIQFKRGSKESWKKQTLKDGQPGFDKTRKKLKIGIGDDTPWAKLPYVSGLFSEEVFDKDSNAKKRVEANSDDLTIITYDTTCPNKCNNGDGPYGKIYLQQYDADPEVDYVTDISGSSNWICQKWRSGFVRCIGTFEFDKPVGTAIESCNLFSANKVLNRKKYPVSFKAKPHEVATLQSPGGVAWLASAGSNNATSCGTYSIVSTDKLESAKYTITVLAEGYA